MYSTKERYKRFRRELIAGGVGLGSVFFLGTMWYYFIEEWTLAESAYMTIITLSTVGFSEVHPLSEESQIFTIFFILMGIVSIGYIANRFTEALIQGYFQEGIKFRQQQRLINTLDKHYILCGFGRTGRHIAHEFAHEGISFIIIESESEQVQEALDLGYPVQQGDATLDESLLSIGIERAICLVTSLPSDAENLYTILSAKSLNPGIRAIARASSEEAMQKLQRAGADAVVSPYITGGKRMAAAALRPQVMDFVEGIITGSDRSFYLEEFLIDEEKCPFVGQTLSEARLRSQSGALVLAIRRTDNSLIGGPTGETILEAGDSVICMGTAEQLRIFNRIVDPGESQPPRPPKSTR